MKANYVILFVFSIFLGCIPAKKERLNPFDAANDPKDAYAVKSFNPQVSTIGIKIVQKVFVQDEQNVNEDVFDYAWDTDFNGVIDVAYSTNKYAEAGFSAIGTKSLSMYVRDIYGTVNKITRSNCVIVQSNTNGYKFDDALVPVEIELVKMEGYSTEYQARIDGLQHYSGNYSIYLNHAIVRITLVGPANISFYSYVFGSSSLSVSFKVDGVACMYREGGYGYGDWLSNTFSITGSGRHVVEWSGNGNIDDIQVW
ncbi:MAG: hypothetical protein HZC28_06360 [Spirochaetes bacterium]|nr:hypothetical protein [Spirochaetota bacterium]